MDNRYIDQVRLLFQVLPHIAKEKVFALKGGTAINLFYRDMPRLSVDIDLTYTPITDYESSLRNIDETLGRIAASIMATGNINAQRILGGGGNETRIRISQGTTQIKIESVPAMCGSVFPLQTMTTCKSARKKFGFVEMQLLAFEDIFGGKIHAALDRQHPRDWFDIKVLYENEGLTDELFRVFMVYVASSNNPIDELLNPKAPLLDHLFDRELIGMTRDGINKEALYKTRERLHVDIKKRLTGNIAKFLLSLHDAEPDFKLIGLPKAAQLPAVCWKVQNLEKFKRKNPDGHASQREILEGLFQ